MSVNAGGWLMGIRNRVSGFG
ncbi:MAG: hypothetical protein RLZZ271_370, partial [Pseudomonadota bacterium]